MCNKEWNSIKNNQKWHIYFFQALIRSGQEILNIKDLFEARLRGMKKGFIVIYDD